MHLLAILAQHDTAGRSVIIDLLIALAAAACVTTVLRRIGLGAIPCYLITGALIGPSLLGWVTSDDNIAALSELAIILLMFTVGMHLDLNSIRDGMVHILAVGIGSTVAVALFLWPLACLFSLPVPAALAIAMAMSMSSTAVVLGILQSRRELHRVHGRLCVGIAITQDMLSILVLAMLPVLAVWARGTQAPDADFAAVLAEDRVARISELLVATAQALGAVAIMLAFGKYVLPRLLRESSRGGGSAGAEALLVVSAAVALGAAFFTYLAGIGPALGAFLAGFMLALTPYRHQLAGQFSPLRDLFMAVFFTVVGLKMNVPAVLHSWWIVALGVAILLASKTVIIAATSWAGGASAPVAVLAGALLSQAGEFSLVVLSAASAHGLRIIPEHAEPVLIAIVFLSLILTPLLHAWAIRLEPRLVELPPAGWITSRALREHHHPAAGHQQHVGGHNEPASDGATTPASPQSRGHVIIAGFGIVGRAVADRFEIDGIPYIVVELNPKTVQRQTALGRSVIYGDIGNHEVLHSARIGQADAVVLTVPDEDAVLRACRAIRELNPKIFIAARTSYLSSAFAATGLGADDVTVAEVATAEAMAKQVLRRLHERHAPSSSP